VSVRRIAVAVLLAAGVALGSATPALAAPPEPSFGMDASGVWMGTSVATTGVECWQDGPSGTIYCIQEAGAGATVAECFGQVFFPCTGVDFATTENMECVSWPSGMTSRFSGYQLCVNSPAMVTYIASSEATVPRDGIDFQCGPDPVCKLQQDIAAATTGWGIGNIQWAMNMTAFTTDGALWVSAASEFSWWRWAVVLVTILAMAWGITFGLLKQDGAMVRSAVIGGILAWPVAELAVWTLGHLLNASELLTDAVIGSDGGASFEAQVAELANSGSYEDRVAVVWGSLILGVGSLVMVFVFAFRNLALMVLVAFAPLAFMLAPVRPGVRVITVWASAVLALLITKPLTMGLLALVLQTGQGLESLWVPEALPLLFGIILTGFMPFVAFSLFDFVGTQAAGAAEGAGRAMGGGITRQGQGMARQAGYQARGLARRPGGGGAGGGSGGGSMGASPTRSPLTTGAGAGKPPAGAGAGGSAGGGVKPPTPTAVPPKPPTPPTPARKPGA